MCIFFGGGDVFLLRLDADSKSTSTFTVQYLGEGKNCWYKYAFMM